MREKTSCIGKRATADVVDCLTRDARVSELQHDERREIAMRFARASLDYLTPVRGSIHLLRDVLSDLERPEANVRTDRDHQLTGILRQRPYGPPHDTCHRTAPPCVHGCDVTARGMRDQDRNAIGRARCDPETLCTRDERISFTGCDRFPGVVERDFPNIGAVHLALLEQPIGPERDACRETHAILPHGLRVVAQAEAEVERVVGCCADAAPARRKSVPKPVPIQQLGLKAAHRWHLARARCASRRVELSRGPECPEGSWLMYRFPSEAWTAAYRNAINQNRAYREAGTAWTFGSVAMVVVPDSAEAALQPAGMVLDVHQGECRTARYVEGDEDPKDAEFVIVAPYARWKDVIEGRLDPIKGMMDGKLRLTRGHLPTIIRFVESARQLVASASRVPTEFVE